MTSKQQPNMVTSTKIIYFLLMVSTMIGFTGLIAIIMAYVFKDDSEEWLQTHYRFQIRSFWIGLLYMTIGIFTFNIGIGSLIILFTVVWMIIRCAKGLKQLEKNQPVKNLESWFFT
jgi:uncharacterized membrane protein